MTSRALMRKLWINLGLTALVGVLVILVLMEPGREPPEEPVPITELLPEEVANVTIEQPGSPLIRLERVGDGWRMTAPRDLRAAGGKVDNLLAVATAESHQRYHASEVDPAELGLAEPGATLTLGDTRMVFGDTDPVEGRRYVLVDDTVHLISGRYLSRIRNEPLYWADNALLPENANLAGIELPDVRLHRDENGLWHAQPEPEGISADALVELAQAWEQASALSVQAAGEPPAGAARVRLHLDDSSDPIVFDLVDNRAGFELIRQDLGLRYTMTEPQRAELLELEPPDPDPGPADPSAKDDPAG